MAVWESVNNTYLDKHKKFRIDSKKLATVFLIAAFIVAIVVFWWLKLVGITITGEAFCGMEEHTHSEDCYISDLVCGFDEIESGTLPNEETKAETTVEISDTGAFEFVEDENEKADEYSETDSTTENITTKASHTHTDEC